jgi:hypothetical protein
MAAKTHTIEVDEAAADALQQRARERGVSAAQLVAKIAGSESAPLSLAADEIAELDRRWRAVEADGAVPHEKVVRWLESWGTLAFRPWPGR